MILNMLSTCTMVKLGKVYGNLMVDVQATNEKLISRAIRIVQAATGSEESKARQTLEQCGYACKTAIVMLLLNLDAEEAEKKLQAANGFIARAVERK